MIVRISLPIAAPSPTTQLSDNDTTCCVFNPNRSTMYCALNIKLRCRANQQMDSATSHLSSLSFAALWRHHLGQEPSAGNPLAGICAGGGVFGNGHSYRDPRSFYSQTPFSLAFI